jgi:hypothetical protein
MQARSIKPYFGFGTCMRFLQDARKGHGIHKENAILDNIDVFFERLDSLNLVVTKRASADLREFQKTLKALPSDATLTDQLASRLSKIIVDIRKTLEAELQGFEAYIVTPKRLDTVKLLGRVSDLFAPKVFEKLPSIARFDLEESAKCIAFERSTASAFHILGGTESVLRVFYTQLVRQKRVDLMWGPMVQHLRSKTRAKKFTVLLNNLDNIRGSFRNPTAHPEKIYDIQEAQDLWALCGDVINRMAAMIPEPKPEDDIPF